MNQRKRNPGHRRRQITWGAVALGLLLLVIAGLGAANRPAAPAEPGSATDPDDPGLVALGAEVYAAHCASCHGADLEGEVDWQSPNPDGTFRAPPHDASGHTWHHDDATLVAAIRRGGQRLPPNIGVSTMPAYAGVLSERQINAVLAYIKSSWPPDILAAQSAR